MTKDNLLRLKRFSSNIRLAQGIDATDAFMKKHYLGGSYEDPMNPANDWVNDRLERAEMPEPQPE